MCLQGAYKLASPDQHPALIKSASALQIPCVSAVSGICSCQRLGVACEATSFATLWSRESLSLAPKKSCLVWNIALQCVGPQSTLALYQVLLRPLPWHELPLLYPCHQLPWAHFSSADQRLISKAKQANTSPCHTMLLLHTSIPSAVFKVIVLHSIPSSWDQYA